MKEVSISYLDAANDPRDMLLALSAILDGLGKIFEECDGRKGVKEALYLLSDGAFNAGMSLTQEKSEK